MKRVLIGAGILVAVPGLVIGYLAVTGMNDGIEAVSTGNIVKFSSPSVAARESHLMSSFSPVENVTVQLEGLFSGKGGLKPGELNLKVVMKGHHRRRLFDAREHFVCSEAEMKEHIRTSPRVPHWGPESRSKESEFRILEYELKLTEQPSAADG